MESDNVKNIVECIQQSMQENKEEYFEEKYKVFKTKYPALFQKACNEYIDPKIFNMMISKLSEMSCNKTSQHDASVVVGQALFDKFIDPMIPTNSA